MGYFFENTISRISQFKGSSNATINTFYQNFFKNYTLKGFKLSAAKSAIRLELRIIKKETERSTTNKETETIQGLLVR